MTGKHVAMRDARRVNEKGERRTTRSQSMRDRDLIGKELSSNQRGQATPEDARSLRKRVDISTKMVHLEKLFFLEEW